MASNRPSGPPPEPAAGAGPPAHPPPSQPPAAAPLTLPVRLLLFGAGWLLTALGLAGLVLPGLQGILLLAAGLTLLSVASEAVHRGLRRLTERRFPKLWRRIEGWRGGVRRRFARRDGG